MNLLKSLSRKERSTICIIVFLIVSTLFVWEKYDNYKEREAQTESYQKLYEENQLLEYEIENLKEQNHNLHKLLELKQKLK